MQWHSEDETIGLTKLGADLCGWRSPEPVSTVTKRSTKNFHHDDRPAETTRPSYQVSKVPVQKVEKKSTSVVTIASEPASIDLSKKNRDVDVDSMSHGHVD